MMDPRLPDSGLRGDSILFFFASFAHFAVRSFLC